MKERKKGVYYREATKKAEELGYATPEDAIKNLYGENGQGFSYREVGKMLGITQMTVRAWNTEKSGVPWRGGRSAERRRKMWVLFGRMSDKKLNKCIKKYICSNPIGQSIGALDMSYRNVMNWKNGVYK